MTNLATSLLAPCVLASVAVLAAGCGGAGGETDLGSSAAALSGNEEAAYKFFVAKGLKNFQAAGIVGNLIQESGVDPSIAQFGGGPGRGIAQWSEGGRWNASHDDNVEWYAAREGQGMDSLTLQLEFIWYELTTFGYGYSALRDSTTLSEAEFAFQKDYEICGECDQSERVEYAQEVLNAYGHSSGGGSSNCELAGHSYSQNTCTENLQCDDGRWVDRYDDAADCRTGIEAHGDCLYDNGSLAAENTCVGSLQCDNGQWVDRFDDPTACR
jgi:hypothetical protein